MKISRPDTCLPDPLCLIFVPDTIKNKFFGVDYLLRDIRSKFLLVLGLWFSVLGLGCGGHGTCPFYCGIPGTTHNYKKCDRGFLDGNKINRLRDEMEKKSVIHFELERFLLVFGWSVPLPPLKNFYWLCLDLPLSISIICKDFLRFFYEDGLYGFYFANICGFRKVGGAGGALL